MQVLDTQTVENVRMWVKSATCNILRNLNYTRKLGVDSTALHVPSDRPERWHHRWTLEAFRWPCTWIGPENGPGSPQVCWRSRWKPEAGSLLLPAPTTETHRSQQTVTEKLTNIFYCLYLYMLSRCFSWWTDPVFLSGQAYLVQKVLFHKRSHSIMDDDDLWSDLCQSLDAVPYGPVAGGAPRHHPHLPVSETVDDVAHPVHVFFCNDDQDLQDPWHPARTNIWIHLHHDRSFPSGSKTIREKKACT